MSNARRGRATGPGVPSPALVQAFDQARAVLAGVESLDAALGRTAREYQGFSKALVQARLRAALAEAYRAFLRDPRRLVSEQRPEALQAWEARRQEAFAEFRQALEAQNSNQEV